MHTYMLERDGNQPLYEQLYEAIRKDILCGSVAGGEKLPSKRALAEHLGISKITVETAYAQLQAEGYISSRERSGYFVEQLNAQGETKPQSQTAEAAVDAQYEEMQSGTSSRGGAATLFPYSVWAKLMRSVILDGKSDLLRPVPAAGSPALRRAIAAELFREKGMEVSPGQIIIGAGTEYFYNLLVQFLGQDLLYAVEDPAHRKIALAYKTSGARVTAVSMDKSGILPEKLAASGAAVAHLSPSHHYPTGIVMPISRRQEVASWLAERTERIIIEDDYDSEFSYIKRPVPTMQSMDQTGRVIYLNTFSKTIAPTLRISYMILPPALLAKWQEKMGFYSCPVPSFEQLTLTRFMDDGYYERHLRRMRKTYAQIRRAVIEMMEEAPFAEHFSLRQSDAGLHFILEMKESASAPEGEALRFALRRSGLNAPLLSDFFIGEPDSKASRCAVIQYAAVEPDQLRASLGRLAQV